MNKVTIKQWDELQDRVPAYALIAGVDLVVIRFDETVSVLYGRCAHRGALMSDGHVEGDNLICGVHGWDYRLDSGISEYNNSETLPKFNAWVEDGQVLVDEDEIAAVVFAALSDVIPTDAVIAVDVGNNTYSFGRYFES